MKKNRGFTLLLAALIAALMAALGIAMFTIAQKEVRLSSIGRDSQFAFYAADSGAECALYLHYLHDAFATSTIYSGAECDEKPLSDLGGAATTQFKYNLQGEGSREYCVSVRVSKNSSHPHTVINSLGYNMSCDARSSSNRVLERAVRMEL